MALREPVKSIQFFIRFFSNVFFSVSLLYAVIAPRASQATTSPPSVLAGVNVDTKDQRQLSDSLFSGSREPLHKLDN